MKARTLGPILMMTLGAAFIFVPASGWAGAGDTDPCNTAPTGVQQICVTTTTVETTTTVAATTTTVAPATTVIHADTVMPTTTLLAPTTTDIGSGGQGLPATGSTSSGYVILGGLLFVSGAGLLVVGRGKRPHTAV